MFSSFSLSLMLSTLFSRSLLLFGLSTHIHLCPYQFLRASHRRCLHLVQHSLLNNPLVNLSINKWWYPHVAQDRGIVLQLFHPHCGLLFTYIFMSPLLYRVRASQTFEFGDLRPLGNCILILPAGIPFRHVYSVFSIHTFVPLFSRAPHRHWSSSTSCTSFSPAHSTTSHTNISQGPSFCCFSSVNRLWWKQERDESRSLVEADFHCVGFACSCCSTHYNFALIVHVPHQSDVLLWYPLVSRTPIQFFPYAFPRSMNIKCKSCYMSLYLSSFVDFHFMNHFSVDYYALSRIASCCDTLAWCPGSFHSSRCFIYSWRWASRCFIVICLGFSPHQWSWSKFNLVLLKLAHTSTGNLSGKL